MLNCLTTIAQFKHEWKNICIYEKKTTPGKIIRFSLFSRTGKLCISKVKKNRKVLTYSEEKISENFWFTLTRHSPREMRFYHHRHAYQESISGIMMMMLLRKERKIKFERKRKKNSKVQLRS